METAELGVVAAELMDRLESDYAGKQSVEVGIVAVVAEINFIDDGGEDVTAIEYRCSDGRRWIQAALFEHAKRGVYYSSEESDG